MDNLVQVHVGIIAFDDFGTGLQGADNLLDAFQLFGLHFISLVQQDNVAELNLLDDEVFDVLFVDALACQVVAAGELALQAQGIHHGGDTV